jgi:hypothetical protein
MSTQYTQAQVQYQNYDITLVCSVQPIIIACRFLYRVYFNPTGQYMHALAVTISLSGFFAITPNNAGYYRFMCV